MKYKAQQKVNNTLQAATAPQQRKNKSLPLADNRQQAMAQREFVSSSSRPIQLVKNKSSTPKSGKVKSRGAVKTIHKTERTTQPVNPFVNEQYKELSDKYFDIINYTKKIKPQLDDEDVAFVENIETNSFDIFNEAVNNIVKIKNLPVSTGITRSSNIKRNALESTITILRSDIFDEYKELKYMFPLHSGGFGAKGRAHEMDVVINPGIIPDGGIKDNHFLEGITLNGTKSTDSVYKGHQIVTNHPTGPLMVVGNKNPLQVHKDFLKSIFKLSSTINTPQKASFKNTPGGRNRGEGQYANMGNTNAAGYVWLIGLGLGNQKWEWLHVRGAGLGGFTDSTNLVAGTRDANTHMIPFESNIRALATLVGSKKDLYKELNVQWSVSGTVKSHAYNIITIEWELIGNDNKIKASGEANFRPLHTGSNISKKEVEALEGALKQVRDSLAVVK